MITFKYHSNTNTPTTTTTDMTTPITIVSVLCVEKKLGFFAKLFLFAKLVFFAIDSSIYLMNKNILFDINFILKRMFQVKSFPTMIPNCQ